ncbi:hypothetical protein NDU88_007060 [Pleurodeles waltl]|uniref:Uncharacterized protein n=1 Tax=Pleurodeles waltl TaxID=8319 RepID=A0AAV7RRW9_PLEWA|nr:hypothetical protein NDU88_007060 [Pleurodeles waltl]
MEVYGSPSLFSPEENQEEAEIWAKFMAMGQANGLEWARKMVAAQGAQQQLENPRAANTNEVQPSDSGLCLLSGESVVAPAKRKQPARATAGNKLKGAKKDTAHSNLAEGPQLLRRTAGQGELRKTFWNRRWLVLVGCPTQLGVTPQGRPCELSRSKQDSPQRTCPAAPPQEHQGRGCRWDWVR